MTSSPLAPGEASLEGNGGNIPYQEEGGGEEAAAVAEEEVLRPAAVDEPLPRHGKGKRTGVYGSFLLAVYNPDTEEFQTISKIGTGFSEEDLQEHSKTLRELEIPAPRSYYRCPSCSCSRFCCPFASVPA